MKRKRPADRAEAAKALGRYREAVRLAQEALAQDPDDLDARYTLGQSLWNLDRLTEAEAVTRELLAKAPENPWHHNLLGNVLASGRGSTAWRQALPHFREAHRLNHESASLTLDFCEALYRMNRLTDAADLLDVGLRHSPNHLGLVVLRATIAHAQDDHLVAARRSRYALQIGPGDERSHHIRGQVAFSLNCFRVAERHYREARRINPQVAPWLQTQMIRETRYLQSPWYIATLTPVGLLFFCPWPWKFITIGVGVGLMWWGWPWTGYLIAVNLVLFVGVRMALRFCFERSSAGGQWRAEP